MRPADTTGAAGAGPPGAERFKEVKGMKKRIVGTLMALLLAATVLPPGAISVTSADVTTGLVTTAYAEEHKNHCICGNNTVADSKHTHDKTKTWEAWDSTSSLPNSGTYYLTDKVTMAKAWEPTGDVELCLNGNTIEFTEAPKDINANTNYAAIILKGAKDNQVLTITDCSSSGVIMADYRKRNLNHGVYMNMPDGKKEYTATFNLYGGNMTRIANFRDDGIYVGTGSNLVANIWGGKVTGNSRGVSVRNGVCNMYGGTISSNTVISTIYSSSNGGGVYIDRGATFNMYRGTIEKNSAVCKDTSYGLGGGVAIEGNSVSRSDATTHGTFNMYGGTIGENTAGKNGGGVYVGEGTTFNMYGGTISGNAASDGGNAYGGGVYVDSAAKFNMSGGTITANTARSGGGVYVYKGDSTQDVAAEFVMTGGTITGNTAKLNDSYGLGGGVYSLGVFKLSGGTITGNVADGASFTSGGGVWAKNTFEVSGNPVVKGNTRDSKNDNVKLSHTIKVTGKLGTDAEIVLNQDANAIIEGDSGNYSKITNNDGSVTLRAGSDCAHSNVSADWSKDENGHWRVCSDCQANVDSAEHTLEMKWDTTQHWSKCSVCGYESAKASHSGGEANCLSEAVCTTCNQKYGEKNPSNHVKDDTEWERTDTTHKAVYKCCGVDATAAENHTWENGECSVCKMVCVHGQTSYVQTETTHQQKCDTCGKYLQESAVAHEFSNGVCSICGFGCTHEGGEAKCNALAVCTKCGNTYGSLDFNNHAESLSYEFKSSSTQHWNEYPCCHARENVAAHVYDNDTDTTCNTCGYVRTISGGGETGGDTPTPTPTPEAPRYYYSSGSGSTGAGGLSAVQNDPNGKSATDYSGGIYGLIFKSYANFSSFQGVQVDGKTIAPANYIAEEGSIEVYLKAVYLRTLAAGKHTVTILSSEGNATAEFTVGGVVSAPKTADAGALAYLGLALSSYVGTALVTRRKKEF